MASDEGKRRFAFRSIDLVPKPNKLLTQCSQACRRRSLGRTNIRCVPVLSVADCITAKLGWLVTARCAECASLLPKQCFPYYR